MYIIKDLEYDLFLRKISNQPPLFKLVKLNDTLLYEIKDGLLYKTIDEAQEVLNEYPESILEIHEYVITSSPIKKLNKNPFSKKNFKIESVLNLINVELDKFKNIKRSEISKGTISLGLDIPFHLVEQFKDELLFYAKEAEWENLNIQPGPRADKQTIVNLEI